MTGNMAQIQSKINFHNISIRSTKTPLWMGPRFQWKPFHIYYWSTYCVCIISSSIFFLSSWREQWNSLWPRWVKEIRRLYIRVNNAYILLQFTFWNMLRILRLLNARLHIPFHHSAMMHHGIITVSVAYQWTKIWSPLQPGLPVSHLVVDTDGWGVSCRLGGQGTWT